MKISWKTLLMDMLKIFVAVLPSHIELDDDESPKLPPNGGSGDIKVTISPSKSSQDTPSAK